MSSYEEIRRSLATGLTMMPRRKLKHIPTSGETAVADDAPVQEAPVTDSMMIMARPLYFPR